MKPKTGTEKCTPRTPSDQEQSTPATPSTPAVPSTPTPAPSAPAVPPTPGARGNAAWLAKPRALYKIKAQGNSQQRTKEQVSHVVWAQTCIYIFTLRHLDSATRM